MSVASDTVAVPVIRVPIELGQSAWLHAPASFVDPSLYKKLELYSEKPDSLRRAREEMKSSLNKLTPRFFPQYFFEEKSTEEEINKLIKYYEIFKQRLSKAPTTIQSQRLKRVDEIQPTRSTSSVSLPQLMPQQAPVSNALVTANPAPFMWVLITAIKKTDYPKLIVTADRQIRLGYKYTNGNENIIVEHNKLLQYNKLLPEGFHFTGQVYCLIQK